MKPERTGLEWQVEDSRLWRCFDARGRFLGAVFRGACGWWATGREKGCTWRAFPSLVEAQRFALEGGAA